MEQDVLEGVKLNWNPDTTIALNLAIAFIMFGVALGLDKKDFIELFRNPKPTLTGIFSQFVLLPFFTFLLVWLFNPLPGLALGMILVAACPGGNFSNFFSSIGKGNVALSISLTVAASFLAVIFTPLNFEFWGGMLGNTSELLKKVNIKFIQMVQLVFFTIALPLIIGIGFKEKLPVLTDRIKVPIKYISSLILIGVIVFAFTSNYELFLAYYHYIIALVFVHNALALSVGYIFSRLMKLNKQDTRTITIETGIQNSALGLAIIFTFFNGQGGMALIAAWWGIWHIISGFAISQFFVYKEAKAVKTTATIVR
ncbi:MAG: bile acid:sodium symporter family protein [Cyclobacteriaceae bacterium]|nr:bile acid:sodium symporter family protein [Cyclobacteriaceae bacterium]